MTVYLVDDTFDYGLLAKSSCAIGVFDGLHAGHQYLLECAVATRSSGEKELAITFDIDPDEVFHPERLKKLSRNADRIQALDNSGVDGVIVLPFTSSLYTLLPDDFLNRLFRIGTPQHIHVGENFRFGARAAGTVETLRSWATQAGCIVHPHHLVSADGTPITSTRIRLLLLDCNVREAARLLGHPYTLGETVQQGRGEGRDLGFATANLVVKPHDRVLGEGVYAAYATVGNTRYKAAVSVGVSPTFESTSTANMEAHIIDFEGDLVGQPIVIEFVEFLRPMIKFDSTDELVRTVMANIAWVRENLDD